jgi:hypothetical protein
VFNLLKLFSRVLEPKIQKMSMSEIMVHDLCNWDEQVSLNCSSSVEIKHNYFLLKCTATLHYCNHAYFATLHVVGMSVLLFFLLHSISIPRLSYRYSWCIIWCFINQLMFIWSTSYFHYVLSVSWYGLCCESNGIVFITQIFISLTFYLLSFSPEHSIKWIKSNW